MPPRKRESAPVLPLETAVDRVQTTLDEAVRKVIDFIRAQEQLREALEQRVGKRENLKGLAATRVRIQRGQETHWIVPGIRPAAAAQTEVVEADAYLVEGFTKEGEAVVLGLPPNRIITVRNGFERNGYEVLLRNLRTATDEEVRHTQQVYAEAPILPEDS